MWVHDWPDEDAAAILRACRAALPYHGRVLLLEEVVPPGNEPGPATFTDLLMLVYPGGKERTAEEYGRLLGAAGLRMTGVVPMLSSISVIEADPG